MFKGFLLCIISEMGEGNSELALLKQQQQVSAGYIMLLLI